MSEARNAVPVIDLEPARGGNIKDRRAVAEAVDKACRNIGFFAITGHGVSPDLVDRLRRAGHQFFALPAAEKLRSSNPNRTVNRGYRAAGDESLAATEAAPDEQPPADLKEFYHIGPVAVGEEEYYRGDVGRRFFPPNIWPATPADFELAACTYYRTMETLIGLLMRLAALALGVDEHYFDEKVNRSVGTMRLNYYPVQSSMPLPGQLRAGAHRDYGGFTILSGEDVPGGLQVRSRQGHWVDVDTHPHQFVVNIGDLLMRWTNDRWLSNLHRVINPPWGSAPSPARLSLAFFNHPNHDVMIECVAGPGEAKHPPVLSGAYRDELYAKIGLAPTGCPEATP